MKFDELNEDQKMCAKQDFMLRLADKGRFIEVIYGPGNGAERAPSWKELAEADRLVPDNMLRREDVDYVPEDFSPITDHNDHKHPSRWEEIEVRLRNRINYTRFLIENVEYQSLVDKPIRVEKVLCDVFNWMDMKIKIECDRARESRKKEGF